MTGFIKPAEILKAQATIVHLFQETGRDVSDMDKELHKFMQIHPVTKEKESEPFRKVNGVYVTERDFQDADQLNRPMNELID